MVKGEVLLRSVRALPSQSLADFKDEGQNYMGTSQEPYDQGHQYSVKPHPLSTRISNPLNPSLIQSLLAVTYSQFNPLRSKFDRRHVCSTQTSKYMLQDVHIGARQTVRGEWTHIKYGRKRVWTCVLWEEDSVHE